MDNVLTIQEAADLLGNSVQHVRLLARKGRLEANKVGRDWLIDRDSVLDLRAKRATPPLIALTKRGRPPLATRKLEEEYLSKTIRGSDDINLANQVIYNTSKKNNPRPLAAIDSQQLQMDKIRENSSPLKSSVAKIVQIDPRNKLNELTATEWLPETVSVWVQKGLGASHPDAQIERQHPAPFSFTDVSRLIRFFTKRDAIVLDPFVGIGSTLKACALQGRLGIGIELNPKYVQLTHERLSRELPKNFTSNGTQKVIEGDARDVLPELPENSIDFVVTSPPYGYILHKEDHKARQERIANGLDTKYSDDPRDLGNIHDYRIFLNEVAGILGSCGRVLKSKKYMAVVVSDFRHGSEYVMFHADLARALEVYDFQLRGITVLYQRHKRVFPYGYPFSFVPNIHHQLILVLQNEKH